jgi:hypothetical protein
MKIRTYLFIASLSLCLTPCRLAGDNRIILYLKHPPLQILQGIESERLAKNAPSASMRPALNGVAAIYGGYFTVSAHDGLVSFPLRHTAQKVYLAITPSIELAKVRGNTISHRVYAPDPVPTVIYSCNLKKDEKGRSFWEVKKDAMPADRTINPLTVVLLTPPNNVFIPEGNFLANENQQLVLPDVLLLGRQGNEASLLKALDVRTYFEDISTDIKKNNDTSTQQMIKNT